MKRSLLSLTTPELQADTEVQRLANAMADQDERAAIAAILGGRSGSGGGGGGASNTGGGGGGSASSGHGVRRHTPRRRFDATGHRAGEAEALAIFIDTPALRRRHWHPAVHAWCTKPQHASVLAS